MKDKLTKSKTNIISFILLGALTASSTTFSQNYEFKDGYPTSEATKKALDDADYQRAVTAYRFWYPAVSVEGIFNGNRALGMQDNESMGISAAGPRQVGFTLNSDTPYGSGCLDLSAGPMVIEIPPGAYIGLVNDHYQGWVLDLGLPGPNEGKGGKHLVVPPGYKGELPEGYQISHSLSLKNLIAVRALPLKGDQKGALDSLRKIKIYPLVDPAKTISFEDTTEKSGDFTCLKWEDNLQFWAKLHEIINAEPLAEKFLPMYGVLRSEERRVGNECSC